MKIFSMINLSFGAGIVVLFLNMRAVDAAKPENELSFETINETLPDKGDGHSLRTVLKDVLMEREIGEAKEFHPHSLQQIGRTCLAAIPLDRFYLQDGTTGVTPSTFDFQADLGDLSDCARPDPSAPTTLPSGPQMWYKLAQSDAIKHPYADTCATAPEWDTQISIYRGSSCSNLCGVASNNNGCGPQGELSKISWEMSAHMDYYIVVHGTGQDFGTFKLYYTQN